MRTHGRPATYADGCRCPDCTRAEAARVRAYNLAHPEKVREWDRAYRERQRARRAEEQAG